MKKILAYIYFFPLSFILSIIISGVLSIIQNLIVSISCYFMILRPQFIDCSIPHNSRTFLADVAFFYCMITFVGLFIPEHKHIAKIFTTILLSCCDLFALILLISNKVFSEDTLNCLIILIGLVAYSVILIRQQKDKKAV